MATDSINLSVNDSVKHELSARWGWVTLGIVQAIAGAMAIAVPVVVALIAGIVFGVLLLVIGEAQLMHALTVREWKGFALHGISAVLYSGAGAFIVVNPLLGVVALTSVLVALLLADGAIRGVLAFRLRDGDGWGWILVSATLSALLGILLLLHWPASALWGPGTLLGINLVFLGVSHILLIPARRAA